MAPLGLWGPGVPGEWVCEQAGCWGASLGSRPLLVAFNSEGAGWPGPHVTEGLTSDFLLAERSYLLKCATDTLFGPVYLSLRVYVLPPAFS